MVYSITSCNSFFPYVITAIFKCSLMQKNPYQAKIICDYFGGKSVSQKNV